ncbi:MAG: hypothetical protein PHE33_13105, partial [Bacteroidales bacterium]|nr:hypothetical protein [Bacteroidales bacterium]
MRKLKLFLFVIIVQLKNILFISDILRLYQGKRILFFCHDFWIAMHQKIMPKEIRRHILTLDFHYVQSKVKIN